MNPDVHGARVWRRPTPVSSREPWVTLPLGLQREHPGTSIQGLALQTLSLVMSALPWQPFPSVRTSLPLQFPFVWTL